MELNVYTSERAWWYPEHELSREALCFGIQEKPGPRIMLVRDKNVRGLWNLHFGDLRELSEGEKNFLVESVINYIKPGEYLGTAGTSTKGGEAGYKRFSYRSTIFKDTGCIRVLKDKTNGHPTYFPILQKQ